MMQPNCDALGAPRAERAIRVLVADDHPLTRLGIRHALGDGFEVCAEADDAEAAVEAALREQPDICLLDVGMPGNGISAAARIAALLPRAAVVMISAARDDDTLLAALRAGAVGYLPKEMAFTRLPEALLGVLDGEAALPRDVTARLLQEPRDGRPRAAGQWPRDGEDRAAAVPHAPHRPEPRRRAHAQVRRPGPEGVAGAVRPRRPGSGIGMDVT